MSLSKNDELFRHRQAVSPETVEINAACETRPVELHLVRSSFLLSLNKCDYFLAECVVDGQKDL